MTTKTKIGMAVVYTVACVAIGHFTVPTKTVITKETSQTEVNKDKILVKDDTKKRKDRKRTKTTVEITKPDGTKEKITHLTDEDKETSDSKKNDQIAKDDSIHTDTKDNKTVEKSGGRLNLSALASIDVKNPAGGFTFGGSLSKEMLGPFTLGVFVFTDLRAGVSIGVDL